MYTLIFPQAGVYHILIVTRRGARALRMCGEKNYFRHLMSYRGKEESQHIRF